MPERWTIFNPVLLRVTNARFSPVVLLRARGLHSARVRHTGRLLAHSRALPLRTWRRRSALSFVLQNASLLERLAFRRQILNRSASNNN